MDENSTFSIVDLETTAPFKEGGHIIQIGISFVKNWKIINNFQTMVNPGVKIPEQIVDLTGIKNEDVENAPYFEDLVRMIHDQLSGTVFVAHNVRYDFPYLNGEFARIKMRRLRLEYVDTVQLAQIVFPTMNSYKLDELVSKLGINLPRHHRADQDASATAQLFLKIHEHLQEFPQNTLNNLINHSKSLLGNTETIFQLSKGKRTFPGDRYGPFDIARLKKIDKGQLIKWIEAKKQSSLSKPLPATVLRPRQESFANILQSKITGKNNKIFSVFSRPRFGKTNAYLDLAVKIAAKGYKILIIEENYLRRRSTFQKSQSLFPENKDLFQIPITRKDFVSLDKLADAFLTEDNPSRQLAKLRVISWLLKSRTGNLNEFVNGFPEPLFNFFSDQDSPNKFDYFERSISSYTFPSIAITDLDSFLRTKNEFSREYNLFIFDVDKGVSNLIDMLPFFSKKIILFTQAQSYIKNWYSIRDFSDMNSVILSLGSELK
ncbi:DNA helicase [Oenococcus oeni S23]|uniref:exonuclease domain-containing protein n=1 Tax=Oenococcus oeni TaxID=1247 RepID=UPI0005102033|nr:exonuclease domain-containing protein [Oenococcus oeni]KGH94629.1 DNA helicase [Oenococcus oeni S23]